ncbi:hypothetical protein Tco_0579160 [Tanacetum coccineum]
MVIAESGRAPQGSRTGTTYRDYVHGTDAHYLLDFLPGNAGPEQVPLSLNIGGLEEDPGGMDPANIPADGGDDDDDESSDNG